ncbi:UDP-Glycosyltransferase/glycogen phosphorylase [Coniochaeta ligniaria NRRL 30616]|uniref:UDP-Glycosyltransferase/glycogen phosphorylase n=1 Tax=Coniochaeta ligniaria NRRL 30616 TaxID=1408157 RepID=A0A1J7IFG8_9PEZI|nr:UDP-Glycosyltransferase/glycogen phosphorylase [Coniochaeta ligniaria NRRL 30616]
MVRKVADEAVLPSYEETDASSSYVSDGASISVPDLGANLDAPPAYGDQFDHLQLSQAGFEAGAAVTGDGRVNININQKNRRLADLLAPTLRNQLAPEQPSGPLPPAYIPPSLGGQPGQTPPPKLNVVIQIVGSRGDVQPFVALGQVLKETYGHRVRIATHSTFQSFVEENGLEFFNIGGDPAELMAFMVKNPGLMPGPEAFKTGEIKRRRLGIEEILLGCWRSCIEAGDGLGPAPQTHPKNQKVDEQYILPGNPSARPFVADAIIANPPSFAHIHIAEKLGIPLHMMFTMPWTATRAFPHPLANIQSTNTDVVMTNYVSYALVEMMTWQGLGDVINRFRDKVLDLEPLSLIWAPGLLTRLRIPTTYCWSPALIPKPNDWQSEITIAGFYFLDLSSSYTPPQDLADFLAAGPPPVYIGFGSIVVENPNALTRTIFDAVTAVGCRALVSKGWGGLGVDSVGVPEGVFMLGNCPHDWLFDRVAAVVHHGGAGTSAAGIKAGKPTVVVPFFGDQPFWGAMIHRAGAGPEPIPNTKLNAENLAAAISEALKPETQARARELGARIKEEQGADVGGKSFHQWLKVEDMRCSVAPSRVAVWRVRRTKTRLSALAAAVLVREGLIGYGDLKLHRSMEHDTMDQPWDPISAVTSALVGDLGSIAMSVADFPREIFKGANKGISKAANSQPGTPPSEKLPEDPSKESLPRTSTSRSYTSSASGATTAGAAELPGSDPATSSILTPSVTVSSTDTSGFSAGEPGTGITSPDRGLSPRPSTDRQPSPSSSRPTPSRSASCRLCHRTGGCNCQASKTISLETAIGAGKGVQRIVETGMRTPLNFTMGLARGFRNAPRLYNDDTVRREEKVTDFASGLRIAGKEFGLGMFDGISGLVTQPLKGAEKEGAAGLFKGFGKGVGGLVLKGGAAVWSLPAYTMKGIDAEIRNRFARSSINYIITSRVLEGKEQLRSASAEEQRDIIVRWRARKGELKGFYNLKHKESSKSADSLAAAANDPYGHNDKEDEASGPPQTGWIHTRNMSLEERRALHARKDAWKKKQAEAQGTGGGSALEDEEFDQAIRESVRQTSKGDKQEDAKVEQAIRASVLEMRRIAEHSRDFKAPVPEDHGAGSSADVARHAALAAVGADQDLTDISDEEYQALIEEAVRRSLTLHGETEQREEVAHAVDDDELRRAIEVSKAATPAGGDDEEAIRRAIEESERAHREHMQKEKTEEEIVLEFVKKQSLAEEEFRRQVAKGKAVAGEGEGDEHDEELKRALEESLRVSRGGGEGGPSGA